MPESPTQLRLEVPPGLAGERLDRALDALVPNISRSRLQKMVRRGQVWLRGRLVTRSNVSVAGGDAIQVELSAERGPADATPLPVVHLDEHVIVVDKPAGMLAHANERHRSGSVAERMAREHGPLPLAMGEDRPGVVHRLDRETSGLMVLARSERAMEDLRGQFRARSVEKTYLALVHGAPRAPSGVVEQPLEAVDGEPDRQRIARPGAGREARTRWELAERLGAVSLLRCHPETGRRHQIRVHLTSLGHPIVGDRLYRAERAPALPADAPVVARQALHAWRLAFRHPETGRPLAFESPLPPDFVALLDGLRAR